MDLTYTGRERSFVAWSAVLGYAFERGLSLLFVLSLPETAGRKFAVIERSTAEIVRNHDT